jgi:uncharacterized membrane protein YkvA (DUF1232 family)
VTEPERGADTHSEADTGRADGFPGERFGALVRRLPRYLRLAWGLASEPSLPRSRKAGVLAAAAYLASPVDWSPASSRSSVADDMAFAVLAIRRAASTR